MGRSRLRCSRVAQTKVTGQQRSRQQKSIRLYRLDRTEPTETAGVHRAARRSARRASGKRGASIMAERFVTACQLHGSMTGEVDHIKSTIYPTWTLRTQWLGRPRTRHEYGVIIVAS